MERCSRVTSPAHLISYGRRSAMDRRERKRGRSNNALVLFLLLVNVADFLGELLQGVLVGAVLQLKVCGFCSVSDHNHRWSYPHLAASLKPPPTGSPWWLSTSMIQGSESSLRRRLTQETESWTRMDLTANRRGN